MPIGFYIGKFQFSLEIHCKKGDNTSIQKRLVDLLKILL
ncbi:hypothetical protein AB60_1606 [Escherichia coli 2-156-04_S1_C3]|nr:hypothetical protein AB60_1606 [Escherichia coli 2-156-04_S1_C3]